MKGSRSRPLIRERAAALKGRAGSLFRPAPPKATDVSSNLVELPRTAPPVAEVEPLVAAVLEIGAYVSSLNARNRRADARLVELKSGELRLRRRRSRDLPVPRRPVTFYSIEYASSEATARECA